jgi:hypothetical protein
LFVILGAITWVGGDFVALAAIVVGGGVSLVAVRMAARNERRARREERKFEAYSMVLPIVWRVMRQATEHALTPGLTNVSDPDEDEVQRAQTLMLLVGSNRVRDAFEDWRRQLVQYWRLVWFASQARRKADKLIDPDTDQSMEGWEKAQGEAEQERMKLITPVGQLEEAASRLENAMRAELEIGREPRQTQSL